MKVVIDFDDLFDGNLEKVASLLPLYERFKEDFKVTMFTIPNRTSPTTIALVKERYPWVALAPHGWEHTKGECLSWSAAEAEDKISQAREMGIDAPIFRAPGWLIGGACYQAADKLDIAIASHKDMYLPSTRLEGDFTWQDVPQYVYNHKDGKVKGVKGVHGHVTPVMGNHILEMVKDGRLFFTLGTSFLWPWEAAVLLNESEQEAE